MSDEARLEFIRGVIEDTLADGPRPSTKHQLERALRAVRIELTSVRNAGAADTEQAFRAGYHCTWEGGRYYFDPAFKPGDPDGAYQAWLRATAGASA